MFSYYDIREAKNVILVSDSKYHCFTKSQLMTSMFLDEFDIRNTNIKTYFHSLSIKKKCNIKKTCIKTRKFYFSTYKNVHKYLSMYVCCIEIYLYLYICVVNLDTHKCLHILYSYYYVWQGCITNKNQ